MAISTVHGSWEWAWIIGSEEEAKRFRVRSLLQNGDKVVNLQWTGAVHSIRKSIQEIVASGIVFVTNTKELQNPYLFHKEEEQTRHFWNTDVQIIQISPPPPGFVPYINTEYAGMVSLANSTFMIGVENTNEKPPYNRKPEGLNSKLVDVDYTSIPKTIILPDESDRVGSMTQIGKKSAIPVPGKMIKSNPVISEEIKKEAYNDSVSVKVEVTAKLKKGKESQTYEITQQLEGKDSSGPVVISTGMGNDKTSKDSNETSSMNKKDILRNDNNEAPPNKEKDLTSKDSKEASTNQEGKDVESKVTLIETEKDLEKTDSKVSLTGKEKDLTVTSSVSLKGNGKDLGITDSKKIVLTASKSNEERNTAAEILYQNPSQNTNSQPPSNVNLNLNPSNPNSQHIVLVQVGVTPMQIMDTNALIEALSRTVQNQSQSSTSTVRPGDPPYFRNEHTQ